MSLSIGIDLGTSTSEIAVFRRKRPELVRNIPNSRQGILPSAIGLGPAGELIVGETARRSLDSISESKRRMGEDVHLALGEHRLRPQEVAARILRHLKEGAERVLGEGVEEAVITVPHAFRDAQRQATKDAGALAGMRVERIINEPTAAALAYGLDNLELEQHVLVYDLGGGTFDVTVLEMFGGGLLDVKSSAGDPKLGGTDFDSRVVDLIVREIERRHAIALDPAKDRKAHHQIKLAAELAKIELSSQDSTIVDLPFIGDRSQSLQMVLTRREFELAVRDLVERTGRLVENALRDAQITKDRVDAVILVGGSTRVPAVRDFVSRLFGNRTLPEHVPPDEAVALGAAIQSGLKKGQVDSSTGLVVTDATPHSLGVSVLEVEAGIPVPDRMSVIIPRNTTTPCDRKEQYSTVHDDQSSVRVRVYQGESKDVEQNTFLNEFELSGIPPAPSGREAIEITFRLDVNQILDVSAVVVSTGSRAGLRIEPSGRRMSEAERASAARRLEDEWKRSRFLGRVQPMIEAAERQLSRLDGAEKFRVEEVLNQLRAALAANEEERIDELDARLTDILFELQG